MSEQVTSAIVAGAISIIAAVITYMSVVVKIRSEKESQERNLARSFTGRLYELRLKHYPEAFVITERLGRRSRFKDEELPVIYQEILDSLSKWKAGEPSFILSSDSLKVFYELQQALDGNPALGNKYNEEQHARIWKLRNAFRGSLRKDVGLLFEEEGYDERKYYT
ncbi:MAG TPA: hypothetical protein VF543_19215 [Pyrinomonadaceae bacterium]